MAHETVLCKHSIQKGAKLSLAPAQGASVPSGAASSDVALMPPTRVRYRVLLAACAVAVVSYIHRIGFATAFNEMDGPLELSSTDLGYIMAAFLVAYAGFEIPCGALGDRLGVRNLLTALVLGW